jgi:hypothetical protein
MRTPYPYIVIRDLARGQDREVHVEPTGWFRCEIRNFSDLKIDGKVIYFPTSDQAISWAKEF